MALEDKVKDIIVEQLGVTADQVTPEASFIEDLGADSLDTVETRSTRGDEMKKLIACLMVTLSALVGLPAAGQTGDFRVENYSTGTIQNNNFLWRGYVFKPSRDVTVLGLYGGSGTSCRSGGFNGAIFEVTVAGNQYTTGDMLRQVQFAADANLTQEYVAFATPLELEEDKYYLMAQGRISSGSGCHYATTSLDFENLRIGSAIIDEWFPNEDRALQPSGSGTGAHLENRTFSFGSTTPVRVLVGFRYLTDVVAADLADVQTTAFQLQGTTDVVLSGNLTDSGQSDPDQQLTLYFEWATNSSFNNSILTPAQPFTINGPASDVPFGVTLTGLNSGSTYWVRAVAINEAGRTDGDALSFTVGSMDVGFPVQAIASSGGSVTPATRAVQAGQTTTFFAQPDAGYVRLDDVGGDCVGGSWDGNTWTTDPITAACTIEINFASEADSYPMSMDAESRLDPSQWFPDNDWVYTVESSDPSVAMAEITPEGELVIESFSMGSSLITVTATNQETGEQLTHVFGITVTLPPDLLSSYFRPFEPWNPRFEQFVEVHNMSGMDAIGVRLLFSDLADGVTIENQSGTAPDGRAMVDWDAPFPAGATETLSVLYTATGAYRPDQHPPTIEAQFILPQHPGVPEQLGAPIASDVYPLADGRVVIEFSSVPGRTYMIEYSDDGPAGPWIPVTTMTVRAGANRTQWIDTGPPTIPHSPTGMRVYRVREVL